VSGWPLGRRSGLVRFWVERRVPVNLLIPYTISEDGSLVGVADAQSGHSYECPECHSPLSVRKGTRRKHFAHLPHHASCRFEGESALHSAAKHAIYFACTTWIAGEGEAPLIYRRCVACGVERWQELPDRVREVRLEERIDRSDGAVIADLALVDSDGAALAVVEILHTHEVDERKEVRLKGLPWIELRAKDVLDDALKWRPIQTKGLKRLPCLCSQGKAMPVVERGLTVHVDFCPKRARVWRGKPYANLIDDCAPCPYLYSYHVDVVCGYPVDKESALAELARRVPVRGSALVNRS